MASIRHTLLDGRISELLPKDEGSRFPIICFLQTDTIGFVLRQFASETLMSALVLKSSARPDDPADDLDRSFSQILMRDILGFVDLHTILSSLLRGAFESTVVDYDAAGLEAMASRFCARPVASLLLDAGETYHGQLSQDWALRGNRTASIYSVIQECFLFNKSSTRMRPPRSPAKCIHHVAIFSSPSPPAPDTAAAQPAEGASTPTTTPRGPAAAAPSASALRDADAPAAAAAGPSSAGRMRGPPPPPDSVAAGHTPSGGALAGVSTPTAAPAAAAPPRATALAPDAELCGILSQIDVMRFLHERAQADCSAGQAGCAVFHRSVKELGLVGFAMSEIPPSPSTTSSENSERMSKGFAGPRMTLLQGGVTALEAFRRMCMQRSSGAGILAPDGTLRHHLSATDLRGLTPGHFHTLLMPVDRFLSQRPLLNDVGKGEADGDAAKRPAKRRRAERTARCSGAAPLRGVLTVQATSTLSELLALMSTHGAHQVHVVDPDSKPLNSVTAADVLRVIVDSIVVSRADSRAAVAPAAAPIQLQLPSARVLGAGLPQLVRPDSTASGLSGGRAASLSTSVQSDQQAVNSRFGALGK